MFERIISTENLCAAWREFKNGKMRKKDVLGFAEHLEYNIVELREDLVRGTYRHGSYMRFIVHDPKQRQIAKAPVRDRVLHHAICRFLVPLFDRSFIFDSYASRRKKGVHAAIERLRTFASGLSSGGTKTVWLLKCDIRKFFDSVDHERLLAFCSRTIDDPKLLALLRQIIRSFETRPGKGIPLGNLTSQLMSNVYLNPLDQYVKRELRWKHYLRYNDDFLLLARDKAELDRVLPLIRDFVGQNLLLTLHPNKVIFRKWHQGTDFLGYVHFPHFRLIRTKTKKRMFRKISQRQQELGDRSISEESFEQTKQSYLGILSHSQNKKIARDVRLRFKTSARSD